MKTITADKIVYQLTMCPTATLVGPKTAAQYRQISEARNRLGRVKDSFDFTHADMPDSVHIWRNK